MREKRISFLDMTGELIAQVSEYLKTKFAKEILINNSEPHRYIIKGIKRRMWFQVVKPELQRIAAEHLYEIRMLVEKPTNNFIDFVFEELPVPPLGRVSKEPPLSGSELKALRAMIKEWNQKRKPFNI